MLAASLRVQHHCGWHIAPQITETLILPVTSQRVQLPSMFVVSVSAVTVGGIPLLDFDWSPTGSLLLGRLALARSYRGLSVTLTHGFAECPEDVRQVVANLAAAGYTASQRVKSSTEGPYAVTYFDDSDPMDDLGPYCLPRVA